MVFNKKLTVILSLVALVVISVAASRPPAEPGFKNLKVLPKHIGHDQLIKVMRDFNRSLGVKCDFCHAQNKEDAKKLDFASDEKEEKGAARGMMKMTNRINKKFFKIRRPAIGDTLSVITCNTCHHGNPHPEEKGEEHKEGPRPEEKKQ